MNKYFLLLLFTLTLSSARAMQSSSSSSSHLPNKPSWQLVPKINGALETIFHIISEKKGTQPLYECRPNISLQRRGSSGIDITVSDITVDSEACTLYTIDTSKHDEDVIENHKQSQALPKISTKRNFLNNLALFSAGSAFMYGLTWLHKNNYFQAPLSYLASLRK